MILAATLLAAPMLLPQAASPAAPPQTDPTLPPPGATVVAVAEGRGIQNYACAVKDGKLQWVFQSPEAVLLDPETKQKVGDHTAGPTWTWTDGSAIEGKVQQQQPSPHAGSIAWLLLAAHSTGSAVGKLTPVTLVRRSETQAGTAPATGCDASGVGNTVSVPYVARYTFYRAEP